MFSWLYNTNITIADQWYLPKLHEIPTFSSSVLEKYLIMFNPDDATHKKILLKLNCRHKQRLQCTIVKVEMFSLFIYFQHWQLRSGPAAANCTILANLSECLYYQHQQIDFLTFKLILVFLNSQSRKGPNKMLYMLILLENSWWNIHWIENKDQWKWC